MRLLTEHPLSGTGCINKDFIKIFMEIPVKLISHLTGHQNIGKTKYFQILQKCLRTGCTGIISHQKSRMIKLCSQLCCLSARCCTKIQHPLSFFYRKYAGRRHGTWLLNIIKTCIIIRMLCRCILFCIIITVWCPRNSAKTLKRIDPLKFLHGNLGCVHSQSRKLRFFVAFQILVQFRS